MTIVLTVSGREEDVVTEFIPSLMDRLKKAAIDGEAMIHHMHLPPLRNKWRVTVTVNMKEMEVGEIVHQEAEEAGVTLLNSAQ